MKNNTKNLSKGLELENIYLDSKRVEALEYIKKTKSDFLTDTVIAKFIEEIKTAKDEVELFKIKKSITEQVEASSKLDRESDKYRDENLKKNKYSSENPYIS